MSLLVAVTGATGFIGRHLTAHLAATGAEVRAVVRPGSRHAAPPDATLVRATLDRSALRQAFDGVDTVVHIAGVVSATRREAYNAVNVEGTRAVAEAARSADARLIHISSLAAAGPAPASRPRSEEDPPAPLTPYGRSKLESERVVRGTAGLGWTILRPGVVYGPGDRAMLPLFRFAKFGVLPLVGRRDAAYTFIHVSDLIRAAGAAVDARDATDGDTIFVGHPQPATTRDVLDAIRAAVGGGARMVPVPGILTALAAPACDLLGRLIGRPLPLNRPRYDELMAEGFVCRVDRMRDRLGVVAEIDLREGLAGAAAWYRLQGWL